MLRLGNQTRKVCALAWRFCNLEKRTNSAERSRLIPRYCFPSFSSRFQALRTFGEGASLSRPNVYVIGDRSLEEIHSYTSSRLECSCVYSVTRCCRGSLELCGQKCLLACAFYCVTGIKPEAGLCVEKVLRMLV